jgi:hypothetical protein
MEIITNKGFLRYLVMAIFIVFVTVMTGCQNINRKAEASVSVRPVVAVILIDGSKSYKYLDQARRTVGNIISELPAGSKVYVRWISHDSARDDYSIVSAVFPENVESNNNAFDVKAKRKMEEVKAKNLKLRRQAIKLVMEAISPVSNRTDIYGALYGAGERFKLSPDRVPLLILLTDMEDDAGKEKSYEIALNNAVVNIMAYQTGKDDVEKKKHWTKYLNTRGASAIRFLPMDEPFQLGGI